MSTRPKYTEPISISLRKYPETSRDDIAATLRWVGLSAFFLFSVLTVNALIGGYPMNALLSAIGLIPILVALLLVQRGAVSASSTILAVTSVLLITALATVGQGLYDVGILGLPVILIIAGLILKGRAIMYLAFMMIASIGWLVFGAYFGLYKPGQIGYLNAQDFFIGSIIILVAGNAVYRLVRTVYQSLDRAEKEIETRRQAESEREALIQRLRVKNQELDRFAVRVSHDLKSPLITLAGFLGYLDKDLKAGDWARVEKDMTQINEAAKTMGRFVDELLDLSRVGRIVNPPQDVDFNEIVEAALKATEGPIRAKQVEVRLEAVFPFVHVDRTRIVQVLQNLITNAVKFMGDQPNPRIVIGFEEVNGEHIFSVTDNGIGIARENHERIFELFSKLNPEIEGTGIGLGMVKKIIEVHHGRIWVESEPGMGAVFKFTLARPPTYG